MDRAAVMSFPDTPGQATLPTNWPLKTIVVMVVITTGGIVRNEYLTSSMAAQIAKNERNIATLQEQRDEDQKFITELRVDLRYLRESIAAPRITRSPR